VSVARRDQRRERDGELRDQLHRRLLAEPFDPQTLPPAELRDRLCRLLRDEAPLLGAEPAARVLDELVDDVGGLGPLQALVSDPAVTEIMVNGPGRVYVERQGALYEVECDIDAPTIERVVERVIAPLGLRLDRASPMVEARLADGSRLHAVLPPLAPDGPCVSIRRFRPGGLSLEEFGLNGPAAGFVTAIVRAGWNVVVSGATSAGKTSCCNALARSIDPNERIVTIEETAELRLVQPHVVRLEARPANAEGAGAVGVRELVRTALRMRPDRLIVGEVRGGEALDMLQACNTGHDGSLSTVHANSPDDALARIETLALMAGVALPLAAIRQQLVAAVDAVVQVARRRDGRRAVVTIAEVARGRGPRVRTLLLSSGGALVAQEAPQRPARRMDTDLEGAWRACVPASSR
jgi:pilus assembly protein CpaF